MDTISGVNGRFPGSPDLGQLQAADGVRWRDFRAALAPDYGRAWWQIARAYLLIFSPLLLLALVPPTAGWGIGLAIAAGALWVGFWVANLILFMHEAAHFNIHPRKDLNDSLANAFLCSFIGQDIRAYRAIHWQHHLHLGSPRDTEFSYFSAPTPGMLLQALLGIRALKVVLFRSRASREGASDPAATGNARVLPFIRFGILNALVIGACLAVGATLPAVVWLLGLLVFYPFFNFVRQVLEHRGFDARLDADYRIEEHGPVNRLFGDDLFSRSFGGAGFNKHLIHHWDPGISYTNFPEVEAFLAGTNLAEALSEARSTYWRTFLKLSRG